LKKAVVNHEQWIVRQPGCKKDTQAKNPICLAEWQKVLAVSIFAESCATDLILEEY